MAAASKRVQWIGAILGAAAIACGGSKEPAKEGDKGGAPPPAPSGGYETSWTGYVSKTFPGTLDDDVEGVKSALRALGLEITEESGSEQVRQPRVLLPRKAQDLREYMVRKRYGKLRDDVGAPLVDEGSYKCLALLADHRLERLQPFRQKGAL